MSVILTCKQKSEFAIVADSRWHQADNAGVAYSRDEQEMAMRVGLGLRVIVLAAVGVIVMLVTTTPPASASGNGFAARAHSTGLTAAQVGALQRDVNVFIGKNARAVANASAGRTVKRVNVTSCPLGDFCIWPSSNFRGTPDDFSTCGVNHPNPYAGSANGSWKNDQTPQNGSGPHVKMLAANGTVLYTTPAPWCDSSDFDFSGIAFFRIC
jgi:hypothetical protein